MLAGHAQHLRDNHHRQLIGERAHRLEPPALAARLEQLPGDLDDARREQRYPPRAEVARDHAPQPAVHGRIGERHRQRTAERIGPARKHERRHRARERRVIARDRHHVRIARDQHHRHAQRQPARRSREQIPIVRIRIGVKRRVERIVSDFVSHGAILDSSLKLRAFLYPQFGRFVHRNALAELVLRRPFSMMSFR